jgi:rfaE bifunctional protein kinase chain/domain/rfaE bifunctional protein nucleotidyltransferase chain/domain
MTEEGKILSLESLQERREELRRAGKTVVQCHGCFDIVHPGHIRYLRFARDLGDVLIITVSADETVGKGIDRPYISEDLRLENLAELECVDYVCLDRNTWAGPVLEALRPDIYVKGKEYENKGDPRFARERDLVEGYGGKVVFSSGEVVYSSTFILDQFRHRFQLENDRIRAFNRRHGINAASIAKVLEGCRGKRLLVIGDAILDRYVYCDAANVAAESPVLNATLLDDAWYPGAAAVVARQARNLGAEATVLILLGHGQHSERYLRALATADTPVLTVRSDNRPVYLKTRYLVDNAKVFKVNEGRYAPASSVALRDLIAELERVVGDFDGIIATDFGYGLFSGELVENLSEISQRCGVPYFVDVSANGANILKFQRPRLATPTEEELRFALGDRESGLSHLASRFYAQTDAENLVITLGKRGAVSFAPPRPDQPRLAADYLPAMAHNPLDTVGAGDVFLASMVLSNLSGASPATGLFLATCVSALHVGRLGNDPVDLIDLERFLKERDYLFPQAGA